MGVASYANNFQFVDMKQQNRFIMELPGTAIPPYFIRATDLPNVENNPVVVDTINSEYKIKGKSRWQDISITVYDPIPTKDVSGAWTAHDWLLYHHVSAEDKDALMEEYKNEIRLKYVQPDGSTTAGMWVLHGAFFASVNWGNVDVSSDDLVLIEATLSYDWAEYIGS